MGIGRFAGKGVEFLERHIARIKLYQKKIRDFDFLLKDKTAQAS